MSTPLRAETVGGVSATASPIANSSGSVTNQAIQVLQGPYITNTYGNGIQCQGSTLNITPFVTGSASGQKPWEDEWFDNVYDMSDLNDDGVLDNPGAVLYQVPVRTGQKDTYNLSLGVSATWSIPLDKKAQEDCKRAANTQNDMQRQLIANKRLDFEIARLKNCGELMKAGIMFKPGSKYYAVCSDVLVMNVNHIPQHNHLLQQLPTTSSSSSEVLSVPESSSSDDLGGPVVTEVLEPSQKQSQSSEQSSSQQVSPLSKEDQQAVLRAVQRWQQLRR